MLNVGDVVALFKGIMCGRHFGREWILRNTAARIFPLAEIQRERHLLLVGDVDQPKPAQALEQFDLGLAAGAPK